MTVWGRVGDILAKIFHLRKPEDVKSRTEIPKVVELMTEIPVRERVIRVITNTLKEIPSGTKITSESSLRDDLGADSLDIVDITMTLEEEFGIEIPDEDVAIVNKGVGEDTENFTTVGGIVSYIERRTSGRRTN